MSRGAVVAGGGSRASWFVGNGKGRLSPWLVVVACEWVCRGGHLSSYLGGGVLLVVNGMALWALVIVRVGG